MRNPFTRLSAENRFWAWFQKNSDRLFQFERDQDRVFDDLAAALQRVNPHLTFEFGPVLDGRREFVVSAGGIHEAFPAVRALTSAAPSLSTWQIIPFRQPKSLGLTVHFGDTKLGADDIYFEHEPDGDRIGLRLHVRGYGPETEEVLGQAAFILLDNALGEYVVETRVGYIDLQPLPEPPDDLEPFGNIRTVFDLVTH